VILDDYIKESQKGNAKMSQDEQREVSNPASNDDDLHSLGPTDWLNDTIVNNYLLLCDRDDTIMLSSQISHVFIVKDKARIVRWYNRNYRDKHENIVRFILFPLCQQQHWTLIVLDKLDKTISYYDSFGCRQLGDQMVDWILFSFSCIYPETHQCQLVYPNNIPRQYNTWDCGVFVCLYARYLLYFTHFTFSQQMIPLFRIRIRQELINRSLEDIYDIDLNARMISKQ
jgi:sentrin-specific protease 1